MNLPDLRPLGVGEILDRAVTIFVRRFAVLILILALVAIPIAVLQYIAAPQTAATIDDLQRVLAVPAGHAKEQQAVIAQMVAHNRLGAWGLVLVLVSGILGALSTTALVMAAATAYAGKLPSVREVYRTALARWVPQIVALLVFFCLAFALFIGLAIAVFFVALAVGALAAVSAPVAAIVGIPAAIVVVLVLFATGALLYLAASLSFVSIALEEPNPFRGIAAGLRRTFGKTLFWRSMLVATIVFGVSVVGSMVLVSVAGVLSVVTHVNAIYPVLAVTGGVALNALVMTFIVGYSTDVRIRREGYDLSLAAQEPLR